MYGFLYLIAAQSRIKSYWLITLRYSVLSFSIVRVALLYIICIKKYNF